MAYFYLFAGTFLFDVRIEGLPEMFIAALVLDVSFMGWVIIAYAEKSKVKRDANNAIVKWHEENKDLQEQINVFSNKLDRELEQTTAYRTGIEKKVADITRWNSEKTTRIMELEESERQLMATVNQKHEQIKKHEVVLVEWEKEMIRLNGELTRKIFLPKAIKNTPIKKSKPKKK